MHAVLIDDEPSARDDLRRLLGEHPHVTVVGEAGRIQAAEALLDTANYDLVFLDVELRGGNGFDLLPRIRPKAQIVFVTAHSHYAVRAFEANALDYLVKPIMAPRLASALSRLSTPSVPPLPELTPPSTLVFSDLVHLKIGNGTTRFVPLADIVTIESHENYSTIRQSGGSRLLVRRTMRSWEDALPPAQFVRVHRTTIINLARYRGSDRQTDETTLLHLEGLAEPVRASYRYLPDLRTRLVALGASL